MLLLRRVPVASGAKLQLACEVGLYVTNQELGHWILIAMIARGSGSRASLSGPPPLLSAQNSVSVTSAVTLCPLRLLRLAGGLRLHLLSQGLAVLGVEFDRGEGRSAAEALGV